MASPRRPISALLSRCWSYQPDAPANEDCHVHSGLELYLERSTAVVDPFPSIPYQLIAGPAPLVSHTGNRPPRFRACGGHALTFQSLRCSAAVFPHLLLQCSRTCRCSAPTPVAAVLPHLSLQCSSACSHCSLASANALCCFDRGACCRTMSCVIELTPDP